MTLQYKCHFDLATQANSTAEDNLVRACQSTKATQLWLTSFFGPCCGLPLLTHTSSASSALAHGALQFWPLGPARLH